MLAVGYVSKLLRNGKVVGYRAKHLQELLFEFQRITEWEATAASRPPVGAICSRIGCIGVCVVMEEAGSGRAPGRVIWSAKRSAARVLSVMEGAALTSRSDFST